MGPIRLEEAEMAFLLNKKVTTTLRAPKKAVTQPAPPLKHDIFALKTLPVSNGEGIVPI